MTGPIINITEADLIQDPPADPAVPVVPTDPPAEPQKPKQTAQERIDEVTYHRREAERKAIEAEKETEYWRNLALGDQEPPAPTTPPVPADDGRPKQASFETIEQYEDALLDWHDGKKEAKTFAATQQQQLKDSLSNFNKNAAKLREQHPDFDAVIETPVFTPEMRSALFMTENGPMLAYHLGKNREVADKIKVLPPNQQLYEIGKLETQLVLAQKANPVTNAPEPIEPVGATGAPEVDPSKLPINDWMKWNEQQEKAKIKAKLEPRAP